MKSVRDHMLDGTSYRERHGPGPVLLCLHGIGSNAASFDALIPALPGDWRVIAWNAPGYGASAPLPQNWPLATDYAAALARLVEGLGLEHFHLLGHSLGTLIAAAYARRHPARLGRLTLAACAQGYGVSPGHALPATVQARLDDLARLGAPAFAASRAARLVHDAPANPGIVARVEAAMAGVALPGYRQAVRMLASGALAADARALAVPTSVIVGAQDAVTPPAQSRAVWEALPDPARGNYTEIRGAGHAVYQQAPGAVAECLTIECRSVEHER